MRGKFREVVYCYEVEGKLRKEEIVERYLNRIYLSKGV
ncbi:transglycosylase domain-containing protein [Bacillus altitudinis]